MSNPSKAAMILADIRRLETVLGRFPSRDAYLDDPNALYAKSDIVECFGSWTQMLLAEGVQYSKLGKRNKQELKDRAFGRLKEEILEKKSLIVPPKLIHRLLCVSDMHKPFGHPDTEAFLFALDDKYKFDHILIGGDEIDGHSWSFHEADPSLLSPGKELEAAILCLKPMYARFPEASVLSSNHGDLVYRKGKHHGLPRNVLKSYNEILEAPSGWVWRESHTFQFNDGKRAYTTHGVSKNYLSAAQQLGMNFIQFHFHNELGIRYWTVNGELYWAVQSGCLVDDTSLAMSYNKATLGRPVIGCSAVIDGLPRLFPMTLDSSGRWNKKVP